MSRILVVDDEVTNIDSLSRILMPLYDVIVAKNGKTAIDRAKKHNPDLILLDVIMPDMTGFEVIVELKESDITRGIPVIFITGLDSIENEERGLMLGAVDYITKPFSDSIVKARVHTHLKIIEYIQTIESMCNVDALTNIANRRSLDKQMNIEWERASRDRISLGFLMLDIDHFKRYNDTYGHPRGDLLLQNLAAVLSESLLRPADFAARWGGEEFAALLPGTDIAGALEVGEHIRANVERMIIKCDDGMDTRVTVSIGANSIVPAPGILMGDFIDKTDKALYTAKASGRNQVRPAM